MMHDKTLREQLDTILAASETLQAPVYAAAAVVQAYRDGKLVPVEDMLTQADLDAAVLAEREAFAVACANKLGEYILRGVLKEKLQDVPSVVAWERNIKNGYTNG